MYREAACSGDSRRRHSAVYRRGIAVSKGKTRRNRLLRRGSGSGAEGRRKEYMLYQRDQNTGLYKGRDRSFR